MKCHTWGGGLTSAGRVLPWGLRGGGSHGARSGKVTLEGVKTGAQEGAPKRASRGSEDPLPAPGSETHAVLPAVGLASGWGGGGCRERRHRAHFERDSSYT